jgi:hypothetical protein
MSIALDKIRLYFVMILALVVGTLVSRGIEFPLHEGMNGSVFQQPSLATPLLGLATAMIVSFVAAWVLAAKVEPEIPLACAALSWVPFAYNGGPMFYVVTADGTNKVFLSLLIETLILFAMLLAMWGVSRLVLPAENKPLVVDKTKLDDPEDDPTREEPLDQKLLAGLCCAILFAFIMLVVCRTDARQQAMFSTLVAGFGGSWLAHRFIAARPSIYFVLGALVVPIAGYATAYFTATELAIGDPKHYFAALTRALPLDYASMGVAGAIWGYVSRREHQLMHAHLGASSAGEKVQKTIDRASSTVDALKPE